MTPTGKDYVSIRWSGFVKPEFDEVYTFKVQVNDSVRLWIDGELVIDEYDYNLDENQQFVEHEFTTLYPLSSQSLVDIKIEYKENRGETLVRLLWESINQPSSLIDQNHLFYYFEPLKDSPFTVTTLATKPDAPVGCDLSVNDWDKLSISWKPPIDDGGEDISKYLVEYWSNTANVYGETTKYQIRFRTKITGGIFS